MCELPTGTAGMAIAEFVGNLFLYQDMAEDELPAAVDGEVGNFLLS